MPTSLSSTDLCNISLSKIGAQPINSLLDQSNPSALACNVNFQLAYLEVSRSARWNCLLTAANLVQVPQTPLPSFALPAGIASATAWAQFTPYLANVYVTFGGSYFLVAFNYTSTASFANDLTTGALVQTDQETASTSAFSRGGQAYASGWSFEYALPSDFQLLATLNESSCWDFFGAGGDNYEIMGSSLFCEQSAAVIQFVKNQPDVSQWDSLFSNAFTLKLASAIATTLRQDGGKMEAAMLQGYEMALRKARAKNGGEQQARRFNPIRDSRFNQARYTGING